MTKRDLVRLMWRRTGLKGAALRKAVTKDHPTADVPKNYFYAPAFDKIIAGAGGRRSKKVVEAKDVGTWEVGYPPPVGTMAIKKTSSSKTPSAAWSEPNGDVSRVPMAELMRTEHAATGLLGVKLKAHMVAKYGNRFDVPGTRFSRAAFLHRPNRLNKTGRARFGSRPVDMDYAIGTTGVSYCPCCGTNLKILTQAISLAKEIR